MNHTPKLGPLALLLTVISTCLTILSILSYTTAGADMRLAEKYADTVSERYALEIKGQELMKEADEALSSGEVPAGFSISDVNENEFYADLKEGDLNLRIGVRTDGAGDYDIISWKYEHDWVQDTKIGNLWSGND